MRVNLAGSAVLPSRAVPPRNPSDWTRPARTRPAWTLLAWLAATVAGLALAGVELAHRSPAFAPGADPDAPAWIWRDHDLRHVQAAGFYAVKEFDLVSAAARAEVRILGDAEYVLTLNGHRIGSNRYRAGAGLDSYRVERWLTPGRNRWVVELRSPSGAGGFWFELRAGGQQLVRSDGSWTIYETHWRGLYGRRPMPPGARPRLLGHSPLGRWGSPEAGPERPAFEDLLAAAEPLGAQFSRLSAGPGEWQGISTRLNRPPSLGPLVEFDFGVERTGYLQLAYREQPPRRWRPPPSAVLVAFGERPIGTPPWHADTLFRAIPGAGLYQDSTVRKFRYVAVAGLPGVFRAEVLATTAPGFAALAPAAPAARGVFGVRPPPSSAPVEHEVWRELERAAGLARGKER